MRIRIAHRIAYAYAEPVRQLTQILRLTPRDHDAQHVMSWRIEPTVDGRLRLGQDPFGNLVHTFYAEGPIDELAIEVAGVVETADAAGIVRGSVERIHPDVYLRDTLLTAPSEAIAEFAAEAVRSEATDLSRMHALMAAVNERIACEPAGTRTGIGAAASLEAGTGIAQDLAHLFIASARRLGVGARYVSGYVADSEDLPFANGSHAWAEAFLPDYGWIGFDCPNGLCPPETHVRVAVGLDFADAAPVRGARKGGQGENLAVTVSAQAAQPRLGGQ